LAGLIFDSDGNRMTPTHATKRGRRYRYYVTASLLASERPQGHGGMRVPAGDIEGLLLDRLRAFFASRTDVGDALAPLELDAHSLDVALCNARFQSAGSPRRQSK
jgi:site-specific DNA recombinase